MFFSILHEVGHIIIALLFKVKLEKIEIMPFGLSASFDTSLKNKEIFVTLAGPFMSLALAILCKYIDLIYITVQEAVYSNILILLFNIIPIYPLDGGRIIKCILNSKFDIIKTENLTNKISYITIIILTIISSIAVYYYKNLAIFLVCIFLWNMLWQEKNYKTLAIFQEK